VTDTELIKYIVTLVNATATLPATAALDYLAPDAPSCSVQQIAGTRYTKRYINGGGEGELPFSVLIRTAGTDSAGRASSAAALMSLATALEALTNLTEGVTGIRGDSTPSLTERGDDGSEVWRAQYMVDLIRRG